MLFSLQKKAVEQQTANRRLAKKRVQCLNEALYFVSGSVLADSLVFRNRLLRQSVGALCEIILYPKSLNNILK